MRKYPGMFLVVDGPDGSGKTTLVNGLVAWLEKEGIDLVVTREPGGTDFGEEVRSLLLDTDYPLDAKTELYLFSASRRHHVLNKIKPALEKGQWVICSRYVASSYALQGVGDGHCPMLMATLQDSTDYLRPDITLQLDVKDGEGLRRVSERGEVDRMERKGEVYHKEVNERFREFFELFDHPAVYFEPHLNQEEVLVKAKEVLEAYFP